MSKRKMSLPTYAIADDGTHLQWQISLAPGGGIKPKVIIIHGGDFYSGGPTNVTNVCAPALLAAGFDCYAITYRLAPPGSLPGQQTDGRYPNQTDDVALAIAAAAEINGGDLFIIGGSAGASHAEFHAAKGTAPVKAVVCMSPATQFDDATSLQNGKFAKVVKNYALEHLADASPNAYLTSNSLPIMAVAFTQDIIPAPQYNLLVNKMETLGIDHEATLLPGIGHSYPDAWPIIHDQAIAFLKAHRS